MKCFIYIIFIIIHAICAIFNYKKSSPSFMSESPLKVSGEPFEPVNSCLGAKHRNHWATADPFIVSFVQYFTFNWIFLSLLPFSLPLLTASLCLFSPPLLLCLFLCLRFCRQLVLHNPIAGNRRSTKYSITYLFYCKLP